MRLLLVEKNRQAAHDIRRNLKGKYVIDVTQNLSDGQELAHNHLYDVIILDYETSGANQTSLCHLLRQNGTKTPILMLSSYDDVDKKVAMLDGGADDYLVKPFQHAEFEARIRVLLRRSTNYSTNILKIDDLTLDVSRWIVTRAGKIIHMRRKELVILEYLMRNVGRVVTRDMILDHVWDGRDERFHNIVDVHIKYLRDCIDRDFDNKLIITVYGFGYKIEP